MNRFLLSAVFLAVLSVTGITAASAQGVERSGATYHRAVCPGPVSAGTARCHAHVVTDRSGNPIYQRVVTNTAPKGYSPGDLRSAYNVPWTGSAGATPSGPIIAIVDAYGYGKAESDLAVYRKQFGLPACTTSNGCFKKVNQKGQTSSYPRYNTGWAQETALDLDMASAMCPACKIVLVEANSANYNDLAAAEMTAESLVPHVISNSYGGSESGASQSNVNAYNNPPSGMAITVSSGDSGYGVQFPASVPNVIAVGGTRLTLSGGAWSETAWSGAGSGCSSVFATAGWQVNNPCGNITVNGLSVQARVEADSSAVADPNTGVAVYGPVVSTKSGWMVFGGTSVAAPLIAGIYGANGTVPSDGTYGQHLYNNAASLNDITSGSNGSCGAPLCQAVTGYDGPTGLGTPNGPAAF
jgi:subtilase family serine protease